MMEKGLNCEQGHWGIFGCVAELCLMLNLRRKLHSLRWKQRLTDKREIKKIVFFCTFKRIHFTSPPMF